MIGRRGFVLLLFAGLAACSGPAASDGGEHAARPVSGRADTIPAPAASGWVAGTLGAAATLADRSPNTLRGDFDGDGIADLLAVVVVGERSLPPGVRVVRPWPAHEGADPLDDLARGADVSLAIIHGREAGRPGEAYLLHDPNPISILDTGAARELSVVPRSELAALEEPGLARAARGDVIVVPTEAGIDTYLYWDGATYRLLQPQELP